MTTTTLSAAHLTVTTPDENGLVRVCVDDAPLLIDQAFKDELAAVEAEYVILWDEGPWTDENGTLYYEAFPRDALGG